MTNDKSAEEIVRGLLEHAKWAHASEWEWQIRLGHDLVSAAALIESQAAEIKSQWACIAQIRGNMYAQADIIEGLHTQLSASQQRERAAVEELCKVCGEYGHYRYDCDQCEWRGPQEAGEESR